MVQPTIIKGDVIFKLHDQDGLPFDTIIELLRERGWGFDTYTWILEAKKANWSDKKIKTTLFNNLITHKEKGKEIINRILTDLNRSQI